MGTVVPTLRPILVLVRLTVEVVCDGSLDQNSRTNSVNRNATREPSSRHSHKGRFASNTLLVQLLKTPHCCRAVIEVVETPSAYPLHVRGVNQNVLTVHWRVDQIKSDKRERGGVAGLHGGYFFTRAPRPPDPSRAPARRAVWRERRTRSHRPPAARSNRRPNVRRRAPAVVELELPLACHLFRTRVTLSHLCA